MTDPCFAVDQAVMAALKADAPLSALVARRVYDVVPDKVDFPYVQLGDGQIVPDPAECLERSVQVYVTIHVWSRKPGKPEVRQVAGAVADALADPDLDLGNGLALAVWNYDGTRYLPDPDGLTSHGVVSFRALIDAA